MLEDAASSVLVGGGVGVVCAGIERERRGRPESFSKRRLRI